MMIDWKKGFGNFIIEAELVSRDDMDKALSIQSTTRPCIGQLALERKWLTLKDIFRILRTQKGGASKIERFGEIAIKLNILDESQLGELVIAQNYPATFIGEILLSEKMISKNELIRALAKFNNLIKEGTA